MAINSAMCHPSPIMFGSRVGFWGMADRMAPLTVGSNPRWRPAAILKKNQMAISLKHIIQFTLCIYTDHTLLLDSIMSVDAYDRRLDTYFSREGN